MNPEIEKIIYEGSNHKYFKDGTPMVKAFCFLPQSELKKSAKTLILYLKKQNMELKGCEDFINKTQISKKITNKISEIYERLNEVERAETREIISANS